MGTQPRITAEANRPEQLIHIRRDGTEVLVVDYREARQLLGDVAAALLEADVRPAGQAIGDLLDAMSGALTGRGER